jgi:hypothetical protein
MSDNRNQKSSLEKETLSTVWDNIKGWMYPYFYLGPISHSKWKNLLLSPFQTQPSALTHSVLTIKPALLQAPKSATTKNS